MSHRARLGGFSIDCEGGALAEAGRFWGAALAMPPEAAGPRYLRLGRLGGDGLTVEVQAVEHPSRVHLDIEAEDVSAEVARLEGLGAEVVAPVEDWVVMEAPTGHRFCVVPWDEDGMHPAAPGEGAPGSHRSRIGVLVIDCQTEDLGPATAFWAAALGVSGKVDADGKYAVLADRKGYPKLLLQSVEHDPRVHLDIETDDQAAECTRLEALGARRLGALKGWTVMEAPTGHRFCLVKPQGEDFPGAAAVWGG